MDCHLTHGVLSRLGLLCGQDSPALSPSVPEWFLHDSEHRLSHDLNVPLEELHHIRESDSTSLSTEIEGALPPPIDEVLGEFVHDAL